MSQLKSLLTDFDEICCESYVSYFSTVYNKNAVDKCQECHIFNSLKYINANENTKLYKL